jgi:hypothetical protein
MGRKQQTQCLNHTSGKLMSRCRLGARHALPSLACALLLLLAACRERPSRPEQVSAPVGPAGATLFTLDPGASRVWFYLHADGPLTRLGHNHVITAPGLSGNIWLHPALERSGCALQLAVDQFVVDDPAERAAAGGEYAPPLDDAARAGTRAHMLGDSQLAAARFPLVSLRCRQVSAAASGVMLDLTVTLRDRDSQLTVPVAWQRSGSTLRASGEFVFRQSAVGLEPYSALFGALRVADEIRARFQLVARQP